MIASRAYLQQKLPEVDLPFGRVPGRGLLALPILEVRRQRNRGEIAKRGSAFGGFVSRGINRRKGQPGGPPGVQAPPLARPSPRSRQVAAWVPGGGPLAPL